MSKEKSTQRRVLITGANGSIGSDLAERLKDDYTLRLAYRSQPKDAGDADIAIADVTNYEDVRAMMEDVDTVIHLAGAAAVDSSWESVYEINILGTRNILEAARDAGCRRVVFASTNHVMGMYDRDAEWPVYNDMPVRPDSLYGVSKAFGETLGRHYHDAFGLEFIAIRIGWFTESLQERKGLLRAMWLSPGDCERVMRRAIEADVPYGVFYAVSDNPDRRWDLTDAMVQLGYRPQDSWECLPGETGDDVSGDHLINPEWPNGS